MTGLGIAQKPIKLNIKTTIYHHEDQEPEVYELVAFGSRQKKASSTYLRYEEAMDVGNVSTTVKLSDGEMLILRNGAVKMRMVFQPDKAIPGTYHSPHGLLEIVTEAKRLESFHNDQTN